MNRINETSKKVKDTISKYRMLKRGDRLIVAVSGGPDSICLLHILYELRSEFGIELVVAHFDHGLRPDEDAAESELVKSLVTCLSLPLVAKKADGIVEREGGSLEEKARQARYRFLEQVRAEFSAHKIALGHNLNDQAETVLMRLLRGSGSAGLSGIPPCRDGNIIRPLIEVSREEIEAYLERRGIRYATDSSNLQPSHLRNRIRLELIPALKSYQPRIVEILGQTAEIMRKDGEWLAAEAEGWIISTSKRGQRGEIRMPIASFAHLPEAMKAHVIRSALKMKGGTLRRIGLRHIEAINQIASGHKPQSRVNLPNRLTVKRIYEELVFDRLEEKPEGFCYSLRGPGRFHLKTLERSVMLEEVDQVSPSDLAASPWTAFLNADRLSYPLVIRNSRPGDRFVPCGMRGHKKLKDFFIDLKVPLEAREHVPILTYKGMPIWVCGFRIDDRFKVTSDTKKILKVMFTLNKQTKEDIQA